MPVDVRALEERLGLAFRSPALLQRAMTHPLVEAEDAESALMPERLAALGEGLLPTALSMLLHRGCPTLGGEQLRSLRQYAQTPSFVADVARKGELGRFLRLPPELVQDGSRDRDSVLAAAFFALLGACFVDQGLEPVLRLVARHFRSVWQFPDIFVPLQHPKQELLKLAQQQRLHPPEFKEIACWGKQHSPTYKVGLYVDGLLLEQGEGGNRKDAEAEAAQKAVTRLRVELARRTARLQAEAAAAERAEVTPSLIEQLLTQTAAGRLPLEVAMTQVIEDVQPLPLLGDPWWESLMEDAGSGGDALEEEPLSSAPPSLPYPGSVSGSSSSKVLNAKGKLLELYAQRGIQAPEFRLEQSLGPQHARTFVVGIYVQGKRAAWAEGTTRREAEQSAARVYLAHAGAKLQGR